MSNSRRSDSSRITSQELADALGKKSRPILDVDGLLRDTVAMERIAGALENIADAMMMDSKLRQQEYEFANPIKPERQSVTVFQAKYRTAHDDEDKPIELENEIEIDKASGKAKVKPGVTFHEEPQRRSAAASRRRS